MPDKKPPENWSAHSTASLDRIVARVIEVFDQEASSGFIPSEKSITAQKRISAMAARVRKYGWENRFGNPFKSLDQVIDDYGIIVDEYCLYLEKSSRKIIKATEMLEKGETQSADEVEEVQSLVALALAGEDGKQRKRTAH